MKGLFLILMHLFFYTLQETGVNSEEDLAESKNGYKHVEIIPAEENLLQPQFSEEVEERLGMIGIGKNTEGTRRRRRIRKSHDKRNIIELHEHKVYTSKKNHAKLALNKRSDDGDKKDRDFLAELKALANSIERQIKDVGKKFTNETKLQRQRKVDVLLRSTRELSRKVQLVTKTSRRKRDSVPYEACITVDIPGSEPEEDVEPLLPEKLVANCPDQEATSAQLTSNMDFNYQEDPKLQELEEIDDDSDVEGVYWLKMPPNDPLDKETILNNLYGKIDELHHSGKDILFVPIAKGYSNENDVKHGFLKSLNINPEKAKKYQKLNVKQII